jgi:hypothetical protein
VFPHRYLKIGLIPNRRLKKMKTISVIVIALAMLIALTGVVMA